MTILRFFFSVVCVLSISVAQAKLPSASEATEISRSQVDKLVSSGVLSADKVKIVSEEDFKKAKSGKTVQTADGGLGILICGAIACWVAYDAGKQKGAALERERLRILDLEQRANAK